jgi:hypothetical protein
MFARSGFFVGSPDDLMPATGANPVGHWENLRIWRSNERILEELGGSWFDPPAVDAQLKAQAWARVTLMEEVDLILEQAAGAPIAVKDPRIGVMLPLWWPLIADCLHPVLVIRDPLEIALSLARRDGTPVAFGLAAWELHMTTLFSCLNGAIVTVVPYACLLEDLGLREMVVERAAAHLDADRRTRVRPADAVAALERRFHRNQAGPGEHEAYLTRRQLDLWHLLSVLPPGDGSISIPEAFRAPSACARAGVSGETERQQLLAASAAERADLAEVRTGLAAEQQRVQTLSEEVATGQRRVEALSEEIADERRGVQALSEKAASEGERADVAIAACQQSERRLAAVRGSLSWRVTAPARAARRGELWAALRRLDSKSSHRD